MKYNTIFKTLCLILYRMSLKNVPKEISGNYKNCHVLLYIVTLLYIVAIIH